MSVVHYGCVFDECILESEHLLEPCLAWLVSILLLFMISDEAPRDLLQYINMLSRKKPLGTGLTSSSLLMLATVKSFDF